MANKTQVIMIITTNTKYMEAPFSWVAIMSISIFSVYFAGNIEREPDNFQGY